MKNALLIIFLFTVSLSITAQSASIDKRLLAKYSSEELKTIQKENPDELKYLTYCITNAFYLSNVTQEKINDNPTLFKEIKIDKASVSNFYELKVEIMENIKQYFIIQGTKTLIIVKSKKQILTELNL